MPSRHGRPQLSRATSTGSVRTRGGKKKHVRHAWAEKPKPLPPPSRRGGVSPRPPPPRQPAPPPFRKPALQRSNSLASTRGTVKQRRAGNNRKRVVTRNRDSKRSIFSWLIGRKKETRDQYLAALRIQALHHQKVARFKGAKLLAAKQMPLRWQCLTQTVGGDHARVADLKVKFNTVYDPVDVARYKQVHGKQTGTGMRALSYNFLPSAKLPNVVSRHSAQARLTQAEQDAMLRREHDKLNIRRYNYRKKFMVIRHALPVTVYELLAKIKALKYAAAFNEQRIYLLRDAAALSLRDLRGIIPDANHRKKIYDQMQLANEKLPETRKAARNALIIEHSWVCKSCNRINGPHVTRSPARFCRLCGHHKPREKRDMPFEDAVQYCSMCSSTFWKKKDACTICNNPDLCSLGKGIHKLLKHEAEMKEDIRHDAEETYKRQLQHYPSKSLNKTASCTICKSEIKKKDSECNTCKRQTVALEFLKDEPHDPSAQRWSCVLCSTSNRAISSVCKFCKRPKSHQEDYRELMKTVQEELLYRYGSGVRSRKSRSRSKHEPEYTDDFRIAPNLWETFNSVCDLPDSDSEYSRFDKRKGKRVSKRSSRRSSSISSDESRGRRSHRGGRQRRRRSSSSMSSSSSSSSFSSSSSASLSSSPPRRRGNRRSKKRRDSSVSSESSSTSRYSKKKTTTRKQRKRRDSSVSSDSSTNPMFNKKKSSRKSRKDSTDSDDSSVNPMFNKKAKKHDKKHEKKHDKKALRRRATSSSESASSSRRSRSTRSHKSTDSKRKKKDKHSKGGRSVSRTRGHKSSHRR